MTTTLHRLVFPNLGVRADEALYVRLNDRAWADLADGRLVFEAGGLAHTDTFYNGLTVGLWKRRCEVRSLTLRLIGAGAFVVDIGLHRHGQSTVWLDEQRIALSPGEPLDVALPAWQEVEHGMLFFRLRAVSVATLDAAAYVTPDAPRHAVRLGIVITHFNRQAQVRPAIARIERDLLERPELRDRLSLTVVDNSRNIGLDSRGGVTIVPNRNLGGTGGFVRGLLGLIDGRSHSHALFMDDDASCEVESIARCLALLQYARDPAVAIAGALLREVEPWRLLEKGARFDGRVVPLKSGLDMRQVADLLEAERDDERPDYGAWWFFAFPLAAVRRFPFPFFVRGDDVSFGLSNRFDILTVNGIACFGEDFGAKHGPLTAYLDARYHLVQALLAERGGASRIFWIGSRLFLKPLTSYLYSSARAVTLALRHTLVGPRFFSDNLDLDAVRREIGAWTPGEKMVPIEAAALAPRGARRPRESMLRRLARLASLQGFLLPGALIRDRTTLQDKAFHGRASAVFRYRRVLYRSASGATGFLAEFDRPRFFAELAAFLRVWSRVFRELPDLRRRYAAGAEAMTSIDYWRRVYADEQTPPSPPALQSRPEAAREPALAGDGTDADGWPRSASR